MTKKTKNYVTALLSVLFVVFAGLAVGFGGANVSYAEGQGAATAITLIICCRNY